MKETTITYRLPDNLTELVTGLVEKLGGSIEKVQETKPARKKLASQRKKTGSRTRKQKMDHTYMFNKWKNIDIDAVKLREQTW